MRKRLSFLRKLPDPDKENRESKTANRDYTFNYNGDIVFIKKVQADSLPITFKLPQCKILRQETREKGDFFNKTQSSLNFTLRKSKIRHSQAQPINYYDVPKMSNLVSPMGSNF